MRWHVTSPGAPWLYWHLPDAFDETLLRVLDRTDDVVLAQTNIVHGDFHHRNFLVDGERVTGVFDWEIAGPGDRASLS